MKVYFTKKMKVWKLPPNPLTSTYSNQKYW